MTAQASFAPGYATEQDYEGALVAALRSRLSHLLTPLADAGALPEPDELAEAMAATVPDVAPHPVAEAVGPMFSSAGAMRLLGPVTKQALASRRQHESVLAMKTSDGVWVYPAFQFAPSSGLRPGYRGVLAALRGVDRWSAALWFVAAHPDLDDATPAQALAYGINPALVARLAGEYRAALAAA